MQKKKETAIKTKIRRTGQNVEKKKKNYEPRITFQIGCKKKKKKLTASTAVSTTCTRAGRARNDNRRRDCACVGTSWRGCTPTKLATGRRRRRRRTIQQTLWRHRIPPPPVDDVGRDLSPPSYRSGHMDATNVTWYIPVLKFIRRKTP